MGYVTEAYNLDSLEVDVKGFLMVYDMCYLSEPHMWIIVVRYGIFHHTRVKLDFSFNRVYFVGLFTSIVM